jgi:hypothetical protein
MDQIKPSTLVHGSNIISRYLRYCLVPFGMAYKFEPQPPHQPGPLPILVVLLSFIPLLMHFFTTYVLGVLLMPDNDEQSTRFRAVVESVFIMRLAKITRMYRIVLSIANTVIALNQHGCISNVLASGNNHLSEKEQSFYAKMTFVFFCFNMFANTIAYPIMILFVPSDSAEVPILFYIGIIIYSLSVFWTRLTDITPLIYSCYLGASLGKHVENFSAIYIDTMFDQFMKAIEKEDDESKLSDQVRPLAFFDLPPDELKICVNEPKNVTGSSSTRCTCDWLYAIWRLITRVLTFVYNLIRSAIIRLSMRRYPELPEMKMTKLSSTTKIQISERTRTANNHLIRVRLRRTQIMLSDLRDLVSDINKTSSPIVLMYLIFDTMTVILITTASVQAKVYKSIGILIMPTILVTASLVSYVVFVCVCYDETTKQLKLLINKLFDFIIMNHRVQSSGRQLSSRLRICNDNEVCILPGSEPGAINETWSQFQYTRKLAGTIQFTMGGIMPVTRRLVLSILGHILSAVFISIEIMSIIDTMNTPHSAMHAGPTTVGMNSTTLGNHHNGSIAHLHQHNHHHRSLEL